MSIFMTTLRIQRDFFVSRDRQPKARLSTPGVSLADSAFAGNSPKVPNKWVSHVVLGADARQDESPEPKVPQTLSEGVSLILPKGVHRLEPIAMPRVLVSLRANK